MTKNRLGRGLNALLGEGYKGVNDLMQHEKEQIFHINLDSIVKSKDNPRHNFIKEDIDQLAESIKIHGVLQPIIVKPIEDNKYMLIAGERRWQASQIAGLSNIPAIIKDIEAAKALELTIIENIQRADLNAIEEAFGFKQLIELYNYSQEELAQTLSLSRSHIANMLRLLGLPEEVKQLVIDKKISAGHARCLVNRDDALSWSHKIIKYNMSVRDLEKALKGKTEIIKKSPVTSWIEVENNLSLLLKLKVKIKKQKQGGQLIVTYKDDKELLDFLARFKS